MRVTLVRTKACSANWYEQPFSITEYNSSRSYNEAWELCGKPFRRFYRQLTGKVTAPKNVVVLDVTEKPRPGAVQVRCNSYSIKWMRGKRMTWETPTSSFSKFVRSKYGEGERTLYVLFVKETNDLPYPNKNALAYLERCGVSHETFFEGIAKLDKVLEETNNGYTE